MKATLIPWLLLLTLTAACKKDEVDALPKATQEGKNTMGCLVDGKAWKPYEAVQLGGGNPYTVYWQYLSGNQVALTMAFFRQTNDDTRGTLYFFIPQITGSNSIQLDQSADPSRATRNPPYAVYVDRKTGLEVDFLTSPTTTGNLTLTRFDTVARIVSGTFNFTGRAADGRTVQVTDGRFDMRLERR